MQVPTLSVGTKVVPASRPLTAEYDISDGPKAGASANHLSGTASGYRATDTDLHSFQWWVAEGDTLP